MGGSRATPSCATTLPANTGAAPVVGCSFVAHVFRESGCSTDSPTSKSGFTNSHAQYSFVYGDIICDERHMKCSRRSGRIGKKVLRRAQRPERAERIGVAPGTHGEPRVEYSPTRTTRTTCCGTRYRCWGGGGVLTVGYPAYAVVPPGFAMVPWVRMAEAPPP